MKVFSRRKPVILRFNASAPAPCLWSFWIAALTAIAVRSLKEIVRPKATNLPLQLID
jgi:hypothetical protein